MAGAWFVGRGSNKMKLRGRWEVMKDTVKNSLVKIFFFIVSVMEAVQVLNRGLTVILSFLKIRLLRLLCGEWTVGG